MIMMMKVMNMMMNQHHQILHQAIYHHQIARLVHWPSSCYIYIYICLCIFQISSWQLSFCLCPLANNICVYLFSFFIQDICSFIYYYHYYFLLFCHIFFCLLLVVVVRLKTKEKEDTYTFTYTYIHTHSTNIIRLWAVIEFLLHCPFFFVCFFFRWIKNI